MKRTVLYTAIGAAVLGAAALSVSGVAVAGTPAPAYATCGQEDGSTPGQAFPCFWDAAGQGNGRGVSFVLLGPVCSDFEIAVQDSAHDLGRSIRLACDDFESLGGQR